MKRRDILKGVLAGTISATILPWISMDRGPEIVQEDCLKTDIPRPSPRNCPHCGKESLWAISTLVDTSARSYKSNDKTYDVAGAIYFHTDNTRCYEELIEYKRLEVPKVHMNKRPREWEESYAKGGLV